jgi:hypothetical protein
MVGLRPNNKLVIVFRVDLTNVMIGN